MLLQEPRIPRVPIFALEGIDAQLDNFGERLENLIAHIVTALADEKLTARKMADRPEIDELKKMIFGRLKLKVHVITDELPAAILPFYSNTSHIFIPEYFRGHLNIREQKKLLNTFDQKRGSVDLKAAKLGGIFSEYSHPLYMNFHTLVNSYKMTAAEITACLLHELGHGFYACYYADRSDRTNQVLASIARHLMGNETGDVDYVFRELEKVTDKTTKEEVDKMLNGPRVVAGAAWFKVVIGMVKSQTTNDTYNATAFEERADNFASRFGYGKHLVLGLDKLSTDGAEKSKAMMMIIQMVTITTTVALAAMIFAALASGSVFAAMVVAAYKLLFLTMFREDVVDYTYDKLKVRYLRIRQDAIAQLKDIKLDKTRVRELLEIIYTIDLSIKATMEVKTLPSMVANFIFTGARQADNSINDQQLMEALVSNNLFIQAADLRVNA